MKGHNEFIINPFSNDQFSKLKGTDHEDLLTIINNTYIDYRNNLCLPEEVTFGTEIEYERFSKMQTDNYIKNNLNGWNSTTDGSINFGGEIISPKLSDNKESWQQLKDVCNYLKENNAKALERTGGHIHVGAHILEGNKEKWFNFMKTYVAYEKIITRFFYGESLSGREYLHLKMQNISKQFALLDYYQDFSILKYGNCDINYLLNKLNKGYYLKTCHGDYSEYEKKGNTIEFRCPNGTIEEIIWQNNINMATKLLTSVKNNGIDIEKVDYKIKNELIDNLNDKYLYNKIYIDEALEFADMIFNNNLDKIYFLRQYFKDFQVIKDCKNLVKAKSFIRSKSA